MGLKNSNPFEGVGRADCEVPSLSAEQMIEVDRAMTEEYSIELIEMKENAGRNLAHLARVRFLEGDPCDKKVVVLAGVGGNGGGALVCARRLFNWGASVTVQLSKAPERFGGVPAHQLDVLRQMNIQILHSDRQSAISETNSADLIIDGLIGYSLSGAARGQVANLIRWANKNPAPILALDTPSGVDTSTGQAFDPSIHADATMTLALPKTGLAKAKSSVGELYLADISVPPELYSKYLGIEVGSIFATNDIVQLF